MSTLPPPVPSVPEAFTATVLQAFAARPGPRFSMVLSGGPTARACYENLSQATDVESALPEAFHWSLVDLYMGDERIVAPDDDDANQHLVRETIVDRVSAVGSFTPMPTEGPVDQCVAAYQGVMQELLAGPGIDLIHLGVGPDGHTASLFPGAPTLHAPPDELVAATVDPNGVNPHPRLTLTLPVINAARCAVFTVAGDAKREAIAALRRGDDIPAARVAAERIVWLMDEAAAGDGS
jgi:6-phosphogluconolactonase